MVVFRAKDFFVVVFFGIFTEPNKHSMNSEKPKVKRHHARFIPSDGPILDEYVVNVNVFKNKDTGEDEKSEHKTYLKESYEAWYRDKKMALSKGGYCLWEWIKCELQYNTPNVWINRKVYMSRMGVGSRSFEMAVKELVDGRFIDRQEETDYFLVNPRMVFRGSRMKVFQTEERRILFKKKV